MSRILTILLSPAELGAKMKGGMVEQLSSAENSCHVLNTRTGMVWRPR